jgi:hypothetical protein
MARGEKSSVSDAKFSKALYSAVRSLGWLFPQTDEEVSVSEQATPEAARLDHLDPFEALDREATFSRRPFAAVAADNEYAQELRRVARSGTGEVSEEVEQRMRDDRKRAERESDGE